MANRYFSMPIEESKSASSSSNSSNSINVQQKPQQQQKQEPQESDEFIRKRDQLLKKVFQSRTLPDPSVAQLKPEATISSTATTSVSLSSVSSADGTTVKQEAAVSVKQTRSHSFLDEFIPLFKTQEKPASTKESGDDDDDDDDDDVIIEEKPANAYNPRVDVLGGYKGPYPVHCMVKMRRYLIDALTSSGRNYTDRTAEVLKLKMKIKSKFDGDRRLMNRIRHGTQATRQLIADRLDFYDRKCRQNGNSKGSVYPREAEDYSDLDLDGAILYEDRVDSSVNQRQQSYAAGKKSKSSSSIANNKDANQSSTDGEDEVIDMIRHQEANSINDDTTSEDFSNDVDSRCNQFQKYSNNNVNNNNNSNNRGDRKRKFDVVTKTTAQQTLRKKNQLFRQQSTQSSSTQSSTASASAAASKPKASSATSSTMMSVDEQLVDMELKYRNIRNTRNRLLRKKKGGLEVNVEREEMSAELKLIRRNIKKLRRKNRKHGGDQERLQYHPTATINSYNSSPVFNFSNKTVKNRNSKKKQKKFRIKTNKTH